MAEHWTFNGTSATSRLNIDPLGLIPPPKPPKGTWRCRLFGHKQREGSRMAAARMSNPPVAIGCKWCHKPIPFP